MSFLKSWLQGPPVTFSVHKNGAVLSPGAGVETPIVWTTELWDVGGSVTGLPTATIQPTVAGYYQFNGVAAFTTSVSCRVSLQKNGAVVKRGVTATQFSNVSGQIYLNGTTDYVQLSIWSQAGGTVDDAINQTWLDGFLLKAA